MGVRGAYSHARCRNIVCGRGARSCGGPLLVGPNHFFVKNCHKTSGDAKASGVEYLALCFVTGQEHFFTMDRVL